MCLIAFALNEHPRYQLVLVANRDEFHVRPTQPMHWWAPDGPLAGRDQRSGGTWLAVMADGRVAAVTNFRSATMESPPRSRGELPLRLLEAGNMAAELEAIVAQRSEYGQFNIIGFDGQSMHSFGSECDQPSVQLEQGLHGLSNHLLDTPWPKLQQGRVRLRAVLETPTDGTERALHERLLDAFADSTPADDQDLPDTGVGADMESFLSPMFIRGEQYGTRATSVVTLSHHGELAVTERRFGPLGRDPETAFFQWQRQGDRS